MAATFLAPRVNQQFLIPSTGLPANGAQLFAYAAGTTSKTTVYKDNVASVSHTNPIVLDSGGNIPSQGEIWQLTGVTMKYVFAPSNDSDPPASAYATFDNISGINDVNTMISEWTTGPTPTFISGTQFTLVGDQTLTFQIGRRVKTTNTGGTIYGRIIASAFSTLTTVTVVNDSGALDSGLSAVSYGILGATNPSIPAAIVTLSSLTVTSLTVSALTVSATAVVSTLTVSALTVSSIATLSGTITGSATVGGSIVVPPANVSFAQTTSTLGADVSLTNAANYFDGPSVAQGVSGTWFACGTVTVTGGTAGDFDFKLWDGTTIIASGATEVVAINHPFPVTLSGFITSPAGNIRISVRDTVGTDGKILFNNSGNSKDSTITAFRIA